MTSDFNIKIYDNSENMYSISLLIINLISITITEHHYHPHLTPFQVINILEKLILMLTVVNIYHHN